MCSLERPNKSVVQFAEGTTKRLYHDDDPDCSELCRCSVGQVVTCSIADCAQRKSCQTTVAVYAHAATAFQAYRGECLCFSGAFVCAKPEPGTVNPRMRCSNLLSSSQFLPGIIIFPTLLDPHISSCVGGQVKRISCAHLSLNVSV